MKIKAKYGNEPLTLRNMDSCLIRRGLFDAARQACAIWAKECPGGKILDVGCGSQPYRPLIEESGLKYSAIDWEKSIHDTPADTVVFNLAEFPWRFESGSFDGILCTEVLEHLPDPLAFLKECARICRPGGIMALTVPFLWPEHEQPYDYYRFSRYGIRMNFEKAGFQIMSLAPRGGWHTALAQMLGLWSYFAVPKPWNYFTRAAVLPLMLILSWRDKKIKRESALPLTLGWTVIARR